MADSGVIMTFVKTDADFQNRVKYFFQKAAIAVMAEDPGTTNHDERADFAGAVLGGDMDVLELAIAVATNATIAANIVATIESTDNDVEFTVNSMYNAFALSVV
jgi:hypothetical protein